MMPLNTRRSSTRFKPRVSLGNNGSIRAHCSSENLNNSAISSSLGTRTTESMHLRFAYPLKLIKGSWPYSLLPPSPPSQQFQAAKACMAAAGDDQVIVDPDRQLVGRLDDLAGDLDIGARRRRVAGRVVVDEDDGRCRELEGPF